MAGINVIDLKAKPVVTFRKHKAHLQHSSLLSIHPLPSLTSQDGVTGFTHFVQLVTVIL